jgi:hypothetical protein
LPVALPQRSAPALHYSNFPYRSDFRSERRMVRSGSNASDRLLISWGKTLNLVALGLKANGK